MKLRESFGATPRWPGIDWSPYALEYVVTPLHDALFAAVVATLHDGRVGRAKEIGEVDKRLRRISSPAFLRADAGIFRDLLAKGPR